MIYKIRVILDTEEDVFRDIAIDYNNNLEDLHNAITNAFGFDGNEMASFYLTDDSWNQGDEIPLFNMNETDGAISMANFRLKDTISDESSKLIYLYDFLAMWTFFVELIQIDENTNPTDLPQLLISVGIVPSEAPIKEFVSDDPNKDDDEGDENGFDEFDFDNFDELMN